MFVPMVALAGTAWSSVDVDQNQHAWGNSSVDLTQTATIATEVNLDGQAVASSKSSGSQAAWFHGKGHQSQWLGAGSGITWEDWTWPSATTAWTTGGVKQHQNAWSDQPIKLHETAGTWQKSRVGTTSSVADGSIEQNNVGVVGDAAQDQQITGKTSADGFVDLPAPSCFSCDTWSFFGGKLIQTVRVFVQNVLEF